MPKQKRLDFDSPWKRILDAYFEDFVAFCWPAKYNEIDWSRGYKMLDKELNKITKKFNEKNRRVDKLVEIHLKTGKTALILLHIEIQYSYDKHMGERMFIYNARLFENFNKPIASLAILIDNNPDWRPNSYRSEVLGSYIEVGFNLIKVLDYKSRIPELTASKNPFATVILAQLVALEKTKPEEKLLNKIALSKQLFLKGWKKNDIRQLYNFIDWLITLPEKFDVKYENAIEEIEEEYRMGLTTTRERLYSKRIEQMTTRERLYSKRIEQMTTKLEQATIKVQLEKLEGRKEGESTLLIRLLNQKFEFIPKSYQKKIISADTDTLLSWADKIFQCKTLEEIFE